MHFFRKNVVTLVSRVTAQGLSCCPLSVAVNEREICNEGTVGDGGYINQLDFGASGNKTSLRL